MEMSNIDWLIEFRNKAITMTRKITFQQWFWYNCSAEWVWCLFLLCRGCRGWRIQGMTDFLSPKLQPDDSLDFSQNDVIRNSTTSFVISDLKAGKMSNTVNRHFNSRLTHNLWFLVNLCGQILLAQSLSLSSLHYNSSDVSIEGLVFQFFSFAIQFGCVAGRLMLLVGSCID